MAEATRILTEEIVVDDRVPLLRRVTPIDVRKPVDLSILVVTWNSARWIDGCLTSIEAACGDLPHEVIVFDNASSDRTLDEVARFGGQVVRSETNVGFAAGVNRALAESVGRYVFLLNPDCDLAPGALATLFDFLETHTDVAATVPLLDDASGDSQREFQLRRFPTLQSFIAEILLLDELFPNSKAVVAYRYRDLDLTKPQPIEQPAAAALLIRRHVVEEVGPFDESFSPAWFEDVDYCRRLAEAGHSIWIVPAAHARHSGGSSLEAMPFGDFIDIWYRNMWRYATKWFKPADREGLRWVIIGGMLLRLGAAMAGLAHREVGRWKATRAYAHVLKRALQRWDDDHSSR